MHVQGSNDHPLVASADRLHGLVCDTQRQLLFVIAEIDRSGLWKDDGARDMAHWLWMRYGISDWKARRWIDAAHALPTLPRVSEACGRAGSGWTRPSSSLASRRLTPRATCCPGPNASPPGAIRSRGDREIRRSLEETQEIERSRYLRWWHEDEGRTLRLEARYPAAAGAVVARALERVSDRLPSTPEGEEPLGPDARRADALVAICSARIASDADQDRATIVAHVPLEVLTARRGDNGAGSDRSAGDEPGCGLERGGVIHAEDGETTRLHGADRDGGGGPGGQDRRPRPDLAGVLGPDAPGAAAPRWRLPVPGMRLQAVHPRPSHQVVVGGRANGPWTTLCFCVDSITGWCTSSAGVSLGGPGVRSPGTGPMGGGTGPDLRRRDPAFREADEAGWRPRMTGPPVGV
jgi:hypothetical protein